MCMYVNFIFSQERGQTFMKSMWVHDQIKIKIHYNFESAILGELL